MKQRKNADTEFENVEEPLIEVAPTKAVATPQKLIQGYEWSKVPGFDERLEECLWNAGILQLEDLEKTSLIVTALQAYYSFDAGQLRLKVKEFVKNEQRDIISL